MPGMRDALFALLGPPRPLDATIRLFEAKPLVQVSLCAEKSLRWMWPKRTHDMIPCTSADASVSSRAFVMDFLYMMYLHPTISCNWQSLEVLDSWAGAVTCSRCKSVR